jgi:hypothetical protein
MDLTSLLTIATKIDTPLMLAGLVVLVLFVLYRKRIPALQAKLLFVLALVAVVLGTSAYIYVPKPTSQYLLQGRVFSPPNDLGRGVAGATVYLQTPGEIPLVRTTLTDQVGSFSFPISPKSFGKTAKCWATASSFRNSEQVGATLSGSPETVEIGLLPETSPDKKEADSSANGQEPVANHSDQLPACLNGEWSEQLVGRPVQAATNVWSFQLHGSSLSIARQDQFVHGNFTQSGDQWFGDLSWGNGDTWHNIVLSPTEDCKTVGTNQFWYYKR